MLVRAPAPTPDVITTTFTRRVVVGTVVALGLHLAFREWALALAAVAGLAGDGVATWPNFVLRLLGTAVGAVAAGAGRGQSYLGGLVVGAAAAFAWLVVDPYPNPSLDGDRLGAAVALVVAGGLFAVVGGRVWPAPKELEVPASSRGSSLLKLKAGEGRKERVRPTRWVRLIVGVTVAACGVLAADVIRGGMAKAPKGLFQVGSAGPVDAQISGFLLLLGGMIAGATTGTAVRHGLIAGLATGLAVVGLAVGLPDGPPPGVEYAVGKLGGDATGREGAAVAGGLAFGVVFLGAWMGGSLFPPLVKRTKLGRAD